MSTTAGPPDSIASLALQLVCGWCGTVLRVSADPNARTSHGMCPACAERFQAQAGGDSWVSTMKPFNDGKIFHGSDAVQSGSLTGATDTDYFYFFCPTCPDNERVRLLDCTFVRSDLDYDDAAGALKRSFILAFEFVCRKCGHHDFFKVANVR